MQTQNTKALILVDIQNDFCPGGHLAVPDGDAIVPLANQLQAYFDIVVATQDWHPADHTSFASNHPGRVVGDVIELNGLAQILWPDHCIQNSWGARFHADLLLSSVTKIIHKGVDSRIDSYSAFFDNAHLRATGLADYLHAEGVKSIYLMGLATDYCVKYSCLDAVHLGFDVNLIIDGCRGIDIQPGDVAKAIADMQAVGVKTVHATDILRLA